MKYDMDIIQVEEDQKSILRQLIELYEYDFSEFNGADLNEQGYYGYKYLDHYWTDENRKAYFITVEGKYAGFVLINDHCYILQDNDRRSISEFFVMRKFRRQGIGKRVAFELFDKHKSKWEVLQHGNNAISQEFWRKTINEYTNGNYIEHDVKTEKWIGKGIVFNSNER